MVVSSPYLVRDRSRTVPSRLSRWLWGRGVRSGCRSARDRPAALRGEVGIGERDALEVPDVRIPGQAGLDVEHDRGVPRLARLQGLLGEAEAFELDEVAARQGRLDVEGRDPRGGGRALVGDPVEHGRGLAELDLDF